MNRHRLEIWIRRHETVQLIRSLALLAAEVVDPPRSRAQSIVGHDETAHRHQRTNDPEVLGILGLGRIQEDHVDRPRLDLTGQPRQEIQRRPAPQLDLVVHASQGKLLSGKLGVSRLALDGDQPAVGGEPPCDPDRGVSGEGTKLQGEPAPGH